MTRALAIVKLLADGKPRSLADMADELGTTPDKIRNSMTWLRVTEMTEFATMYTLTAKGRARSKYEPKPPYTRKELAQRYQLRHLNDPPISKEPKVDVRGALEVQPALSQVWRQA